MAPNFPDLFEFPNPGHRGHPFQELHLGPQSGGFQAAMQGGRLLDAGMLNTMILYVSALMEV
jgi:L-serine dehydratase